MQKTSGEQLYELLVAPRSEPQTLRKSRYGSVRAGSSTADRSLSVGNHEIAPEMQFELWPGTAYESCSQAVARRAMMQHSAARWE